MAKASPSTSSQGLADLKAFIKQNKARLAAAFGFFLLPWLANFFLFYEAAVLVALVEIGVLVYYRRKKR
jgi:hypothetical protein